MKEMNIEGQLIYVAHPYGGKEENVRRAGECLRKLKKMYPYQTLFSPLHNWDWDSYDADHQAKPMPGLFNGIEEVRCHYSLRDVAKEYGVHAGIRCRPYLGHSHIGT